MSGTSRVWHRQHPPRPTWARAILPFGFLLAALISACATPPDTMEPPPSGSSVQPTSLPTGQPTPQARSQLLDGFELGMNYAPQGYLDGWVADGWPLVQRTVQRDLAILASMGVHTVRIMLLPYRLGMLIQPDLQPGTLDEAGLDALASNLPDALATLDHYDIRAVLAFGPNAYYWNGPDPNTTWLAYTYGDDGWDAWSADYVAWCNRVIATVEQSQAADVVAYYDLHNEVDLRVAGMDQLVTRQLREIRVPDGKLGLSLLESRRLSDLARLVADAGEPLDYLEIHTYPDRAANTGIANWSEEARSLFPETRIVLGEYGGIWCENGQDASKQADIVEEVLDAARQANIPALHWMLWDRAAGTSCNAGCERVGLGFSVQAPRKAYEILAAQAIAVGDFNVTLSSQEWMAWPFGTEILRHAPRAVDPQTQFPSVSLEVAGEGSVWLCSPPLDGQDGLLAVAGYVRSSHPEIVIAVVEGDGRASEEVSRSYACALPKETAWNQLQICLSGTLLATPADSTFCRVCVGIQGKDGQSVRLELAAMSAAPIRSPATP